MLPAPSFLNTYTVSLTLLKVDTVVTPVVVKRKLENWQKKR